MYMQVDTGCSRVIFIVSESKAGNEGVEKLTNKKKDDKEQNERMAE